MRREFSVARSAATLTEGKTMFSSLKARMIAFVLIVIVVISTLLCGVAYWKTKEAMSRGHL